MKPRPVSEKRDYAGCEYEQRHNGQSVSCYIKQKGIYRVHINTSVSFKNYKFNTTIKYMQIP